MSTYVVDIETDGFIAECTTIHSLCMKNIETGFMHSFAKDKVVKGDVVPRPRLPFSRRVSRVDDALSTSSINLPVPVESPQTVSLA